MFFFEVPIPKRSSHFRSEWQSVVDLIINSAVSMVNTLELNKYRRVSYIPHLRSTTAAHVDNTHITATKKTQRQRLPG